jgi:HEPN domain-containing protein
MDEAKRELVAAWLTKGQDDLASARKLAAPPDPLLGTAIYHCQQAAEKAVKGLLLFHDQDFEKTHDITDLLRLAAPYAPELNAFFAVGEVLTPYAVKFRYPGAAADPQRAEYDLAHEAADQLLACVLDLLPPAVHPGISPQQSAESAQT